MQESVSLSDSEDKSEASVLDVFTAEDEELLKSKQRARMKFKSLVKRVMENKIWLRRSVVHTVGNINVVGDLYQSPENRSESQINNIEGLLSEFSCFDHLGMFSKKELAKCIRYQIVQPGHVIVRQGAEAWAMYVVFSGEIRLSKEDVIINTKYSEMKTSFEHAGYIFGHFEVLLNQPRHETITSSRLCQLLVIPIDTFNEVLREGFFAKYVEVSSALNSFSYFDAADTPTRQEICLLGEVICYKKNAVVYSSEKSLKDSFFILRGRCDLMEKLRVVRSSHFHHHDNFDSYSRRNTGIDVTITSQQSVLETRKPRRNVTLQENRSRSHINAVDQSLVNLNRLSKVHWRSKGDIHHIYQDRDKVDRIRKKFINKTSRTKISCMRTDIINNKTNLIFKHSYACRELIRLAIQAKTKHLPIDEFGIDNLFHDITKSEENEESMDNYETHIIHVATFNSGACFNIGENMENRNVVAQTNVLVLRIPRYLLLLQKITWEQMKQHLNDLLPSNDDIFNSFIKNRIYLSLRREMINKIITAKDSCRAKNTVKNIPYSIRLRNDFDFTDKYHRLRHSEERELKNTNYYDNTIKLLLNKF